MFNGIFSTLFSSLGGFLLKLLLFLFKVVLIVFLPFLVACVIYFFYYKIKGYKPIQDERGKLENLTYSISYLSYFLSNL